MDPLSNSATAANPLFDLQRTLYSSGNYTRRRLHRDRLRWVTAAIARYAGSIPVSRAVEYGPGSGVYLPVLAGHCREVTGADIEQAYLEGIQPLSRLFSGITLAVDDIQSSAFDDDTFGLALCTEVLEHVPDPERSLETLHRILHRGGVAIVTTPQRYSLMELCCRVALLPGLIDVARAVYREPILPTGHISLRTRRAFVAAIREAGFETLEESRFGLYVPVLAEFAGSWGGRAIASLERKLAGSIAENLFWTQAYVLRKRP